jgi:anti-anti-sigma factor
MGKSLTSAVSKSGGSAFECRQRQAGGVVILDLAGHLTQDETSDDFHARLRRLARAGKTRLVLNLRYLAPLDATGLCALLVDLVKVRQSGGDLRLVDVQPPNMDLLLRTKTDVAFRIFTSEQDAVNDFCGALCGS